MIDPSPRNAAGSGRMLAAMTALCAGIGLAAGPPAGAPALFPPAGLFAALLVGFALVYARSKDL